MTNNELERLADLVARNIIQQIKQDDELLDRIFPSRLLDSSEAAEFLRIPMGSFYQIVKTIPHHKIGKRLVFDERSLTTWVMNKKENEI